jgi:hypothetical protein
MLTGEGEGREGKGRIEGEQDVKRTSGEGGEGDKQGGCSGVNSSSW